MNTASRPSCLPGTRIEILDQINGWLSKPSDSGNVLWLCGVAGSGKSTISTSASESFRGLERLGAYLFFDRNDRVRSNPDSVIRTLAYELAQFNAHIASAISTAIHRDPGIVKATIQKPFKALLLDPLNLVQSSIQGPITIILDALDECGDPASPAVLLSVLSTELLKLPQVFRFLITSREEKDITDYFQAHFSCSRKQLDVSMATPDIALFIDHEFGLIRKREGLGSAWPGQSNMQQLVDLSGGLFIWASTATKFIAEYDPDAQLQILLSQNTAGSFNLDQLYAIALRNSGPWDTTSWTQQWGVICLLLSRWYQSCIGISGQDCSRLGC
ncbi:hypothetical protein K438DRAFT_1010994 [Mycena galopus ATCC 62051]|nr:hypothetical protein K438DRAFT_1010994 [Mycena galopus ATCC 62051]